MTEQQAPESQAGSEQDQASASGSSQDQASSGQGNQQGNQQQRTDQQATSVEELPAWAQKIVGDLRTENANYRTAQKQRDDANKSEVERLTEDNQTKDERIATLEGRLKRASVIEQFGANGRAGWAMANDLGLEFEFNDELRATNVDKVRKELEKQEPTIFGAGQADAGSRTAGDGGYQGPPGRERMTWAYQNKRT